METKRTPRAFPVTFSNGVTRYFLTGSAAFRYAQKRGLTLKVQR